jgi:hypothetical protein
MVCHQYVAVLGGRREVGTEFFVFGSSLLFADRIPERGVETQARKRF